ncbi:MAG TPA: alkaline phosphatase family protein [Candidatus Baltobacteraceae bacterium]|jgi:acid phosphatase
MRRIWWIAGVALVLVIAAAAFLYFRSGHTRLTELPPLPIAKAGHMPVRPAHVIVIVEENKAYEDIVGDTKDAPYLNELIARGALFTRSYGVAHPSQPNYFALFAGRVNSNGDACAVAGIPTDAPNLGAELRRAGKSFTGYAEGLPEPGYSGCSAGSYARKHAPWTHFSSVPASESQPFSRFPPYANLPTVAFLIPNELDDMHSASIARADAWLRRNVAPLVAWAELHNTLVIVTWDESSKPLTNHIPTLFIGPMVRPGRYDVVISHYHVLRTIESFFGLPPLGSSAGATPIAGIWR